MTDMTELPRRMDMSPEAHNLGSRALATSMWMEGPGPGPSKMTGRHDLSGRPSELLAQVDANSSIQGIRPSQIPPSFGGGSEALGLKYTPKTGHEGLSPDARTDMPGDMAGPNVQATNEPSLPVENMLTPHDQMPH